MTTHFYKQMTALHGRFLSNECRIDWAPDGIDEVKHNALTYINSQPDDSTYYTDGSSDDTRVAAAFVHQQEETVIWINISIST